MTDVLSWMPLEAARDLGWTLIHFLWQGLVLAALLNGVLPLCRSAIARHNCALVTLTVMALAPVATFLFLHDFRQSGAALSWSAAAGPLAAAPGFAPWTNGLVVLWLTELWP